MSFLFLYCRPGFENECAAEIQELAAQQAVFGYCKAKQNAAYVTFHPNEADKAEQLIELIPFSSLIFCRQWFFAIDILNALPVDNRISPLLQVVTNAVDSVVGVDFEHLDTNQGKALSKLCKSIERPFLTQLRKLNLLGDRTQTNKQLHVCFLNTAAAAIGYSYTNNDARWPMGIPRLKFPGSAPSRSTLKLDEAFLTFLEKSEIPKYLHSGMRAVDLGAAPGGWTWQLVKHQLQVTAIDNGPMQPELMDTGLVKHMRIDAFTFEPENPVDWMVCDIVDKPARVNDLMIRWLLKGWCKKTIFNLKLPMKQRYAEVSRLLHNLQQALNDTNITHSLQCKQLYHDREEVTVFVDCA